MQFVPPPPVSLKDLLGPAADAAARNLLKEALEAEREGVTGPYVRTMRHK